MAILKLFDCSLGCLVSLIQFLSAWVSAREDDCCKTATEVVGVFGEEEQDSRKWLLYLKSKFNPLIKQRDDLYTTSGRKKLPLPNEYISGNGR